MSVDVVSQAESELSAQVVIEISAMIGRRRMSQASLGRAVDKSPVWVSDRMTGRVKLTVDDLALIARGLRCRVLDLLPRGVTGEDVPNMAPIGPAVLQARHRPLIPASAGARRTAPTGR